MFLKRFKEKSNQKFLNRLLKERKTSVTHKKVETIGVILNYEEFNDYDAIRLFFKSVGIKEKNLKIIAYLNDEKEAPNSWDNFYFFKDFGWHGKILNQSINNFIETKFDVLLSFYSKNCYELSILTAASNANFKIGITDYDERLNDCIIKVSTQEFNIFKQEVLKYLKVLNKI